MNNTLIEPTIVAAQLAAIGISDLNNATIRQTVSLVKGLEAASGERFVRFEIGSPGLSAPEIGVETEIEALRGGISSKYPDIEGLQELKDAASQFIKAFINVDVSPVGCIPTVGSMQAAFAIFMLCSQLDSKRDMVLFIDPGFSVQKTQTNIIGLKKTSFDVSQYRGAALRTKLEEYLKAGNITAIVYSNPNNPTWLCLTDEELRIIGELATQYDTLVVEDLAYLAMDFRHDLSRPFEPPYQPSVAHYTDNWVMMVSASKIFSYAGARIAIMAISDKMFNRRYESLDKRYGMPFFGQAMIHAFIYGLSSGTAHSAQYALAAMMRAANEGRLDFVGEVSEYGRRSKRLKEIFTKHGFRIIYDSDGTEALADGFYFTVGYKDMEGGELLKKLLHYGISAIVLSTTGSIEQGLRICSSTANGEWFFEELDRRLEMFKAQH